MASKFCNSSNVTVVSLIALVCCHECVYNTHSILGYAGYLDRKDWVHLVFFPCMSLFTDLCIDSIMSGNSGRIILSLASFKHPITHFRRP